MYGPGLIFSRSGNRSKLYRVSPLLFSQKHLNNQYYLPGERELSAHGLITRFYAFDFGFANPNSSIAPMQQEFCPLVLGRDFLVWAVTGNYTVAPPQLLTNPATTPYGVGAAQLAPNQSPGFLVNFLHTHDGVQRQWANKPLTDGESVGTGRHPLMLPNPALLTEGDTITCVIQNLSNATLQAQILFHGAEFDTETYGQEQGAA